MDEGNTKDISDKTFPRFFSKNLVVESIGVSFLQIGIALGWFSGSGDLDLGGGEVVKSLVAAKVYFGLDNILSGFGEGEIIGAKYWADIYGLSVDSDLIKRKVNVILEAYDVVGENVI
jgi:hypothetical protein